MLDFVRLALRVSRRALRWSLRALSATCTWLGWHARPDFLIIGAEKSGTTALHYYLASHPDVVAPFTKELNYFSPETAFAIPDSPEYEWFARIAEGDLDPAIRKETLRWYHSQFRVPIPGRHQLFYESTPCYLFFPQVARRIHAYRTDMKLIALLRDPVERAYSSWNMASQWAEYPWIHDKRSFEAALSEEIEQLTRDPTTLKSYYLRQGIYHEQLRRYFELFPRQQILIIEHGELLSNRSETLNTVCRFLGIPPFSSTRAWPELNVGTYSSGISPAIRDFLAEFYAPHNKALFDLIGRTFEWTAPAARSQGAAAVTKVTPPRTARPTAR